MRFVATAHTPPGQFNRTMQGWPSSTLHYCHSRRQMLPHNPQQNTPKPHTHLFYFLFAAGWLNQCSRQCPLPPPATAIQPRPQALQILCAFAQHLDQLLLACALQRRPNAACDKLACNFFCLWVWRGVCSRMLLQQKHKGVNAAEENVFEGDCKKRTCASHNQRHKPA